MWSESPFGVRVLALLAWLALASGVELAWRGGRAVRWRASLFLVAAGLLGAAWGLAIDAVTSSLSPVYFTIGQGLGSGDGWRGRALLLGMRAGASAGVVAGCAFVAAALPGRRPPAPWRCVGAQVRLPLLWSLALGTAGALAGALLVPPELLGGPRAGPGAAEMRPFATVWCAHGSVYLGGCVGTVIGMARIRRVRTPGTPPRPSRVVHRTGARAGP